MLYTCMPLRTKGLAPERRAFSFSGRSDCVFIIAAHVPFLTPHEDRHVHRRPVYGQGSYRAIHTSIELYAGFVVIVPFFAS
jgi:hypothetical protein